MDILFSAERMEGWIHTVHLVHWPEADILMYLVLQTDTHKTDALVLELLRYIDLKATVSS
jgi:hypothetical protein